MLMPKYFNARSIRSRRRCRFSCRLVRLLDLRQVDDFSQSFLDVSEVGQDELFKLHRIVRVFIQKLRQARLQFKAEVFELFQCLMPIGFGGRGRRLGTLAFRFGGIRLLARKRTGLAVLSNALG